MTSSVHGRVIKSLVIASAAWSLLWMAVSLVSGGWIPAMLWAAPLLAMFVKGIGIGLLIALAINAVVDLIKRQRFFKALILAFIIVGAYWVGVKLPSRPGMTFYLHRDEFVALAEEAIDEIPDPGFSGVRLPASPLYEMAKVYQGFYSDALVIDFIIDDFYLPLVYISTDEPGDVYDTCAFGGFPIERLEANWYVCRRDWN